MSDDSASLELRSVVQRFNDSTEVLGQLRERLRSLAEAEDSQAASAESLDDASEHLRSFTTQIEQSTATLQAAVDETRAAMAVAREFLEGTDLKAVRGDLSQLERVVAAGNGALEVSVARIVELLEREVVGAKGEASHAVLARQQLEAKIAAIPEKTRRKFGL